MTAPVTQRSLDFIASCNDPKQLRQIAQNAGKQSSQEVQQAARLRLYAVLSSEEPGTQEYDVWQSIHALEDTLTTKRGKTTRLARTRQRIERDKEVTTVSDLVRKRPTEGFHLLIERSLPELTFEAVAPRHPERFASDVLDAAAVRLETIGYMGERRA